jgi:hypothetical protein
MSFTRRIRPFVDHELAAAEAARRGGDDAAGFRFLERAHVLGQASTVEHVRVHWRMLCWSVRNRRPAEFAGQLLRLTGAAVLTGVGWVPAGNTGGSNVSPFQAMPVADDLRAILAFARRGRAATDSS